ncbi:MAG: hypothetical protein ACREQJ_00600, partial [Candidatus Binatia bacterium]
NHGDLVREPRAMSEATQSPLRRAAGAALIVMVTSAVALAQQPGFLVRVRTVLATDSGTELDARLDERQRRQLINLFRYSSFRIVSEESRECDLDSPQSFQIPGGRFLQVKPLGTRNDRLRMKVMLIDGASPPPLDTLFSVPNHGNIWLAGPRHPDGTLLISIDAEAAPR